VEVEVDSESQLDVVLDNPKLQEGEEEQGEEEVLALGISGDISKIALAQLL
jgi:hypothetical protein